MINREIYLKDPTSHKLVNEGVASVNDNKTSEELAVLRYELETFVCDGQYEKGMVHILDTFLRNLSEAQQPAVWVSGFFGSGKSHLVKMLRSLWINTVFSDNAVARGVAALSTQVKDLFKELDTAGKRFGGLHAASGTLGAGASGSVRLALLRIIFKSVDLPENYGAARFVMWLKKENIYESVRNEVEKDGSDWNEELDNFIVAETLHNALVKVKPNLFASAEVCVAALNNLFPYVQDISSVDMINAIRQALTTDSKFPLTLIALDEVQQFIGDDSLRSTEVQEVVEACCKNIGSHVLFIGTGQTAVTGTSNLKKLEGRFTIRVELSDADVDAVIRKVILAKKPEANKPIEEILQKNLGEISRQLSGSVIAHRNDDISHFPQDYPILPVRRRFWESCLRVLDQTGTDSQLRNQLAMIHKVIQTNLDKPLGNAIPADFLYFDSANRLLQARILPRKLFENTIKWEKGNDEQRLMARSCAIVFLINKLTAHNKETGIKATANTIADLLVEDLSVGSGELRSKLPLILKKCDMLMLVDNEYHIQTEESTAWNDEFRSEIANLTNETHRIESERNDRIRKLFSEHYRKTTLNQGSSKVPRDITVSFDSQMPKDSSKVYVLVREGWNVEVNSVQADAGYAGNQSPLVFVFIPKRSADDIRHFLIENKAAAKVLDSRGSPNTPEGIEARAVIETARQAAEGKIKELLEEAFSGARVFQGGGNEITGIDLQSMIEDAANNALKRLYPQFNAVDNPGWAKVYENASKGSPDALKAVGDSGEVDKNAVCKTILTFIGGGKRGADIRAHFEGTPYGWPHDAVDGALQVLLVAGLVRSQDDRGSIVDPKELDRKNINKTFFKVESVTITTAHRIQIRKLLQTAGISVKPNEEQFKISEFLAYLAGLAERSGGDAPRPVKPDTNFIEELRLSAGNEQLISLYNQADDITALIGSWNKVSRQIEKRMPNWILLKQLAFHCHGIGDSEIIEAQIKTIETERQLLQEPDPVTPLLASVTQVLRDELNQLNTKYNKVYQAGLEKLEQDDAWRRLEPDQKHEFLKKNTLIERMRPMVNVETPNDILATLNAISISAFNDRLAALPARVNASLNAASKLFEPKSQNIQVPSRTIKTEAELETWLAEVKTQLSAALKNGPVVIR
jgi:hypothetical protein